MIRTNKYFLALVIFFEGLLLFIFGLPLTASAIVSLPEPHIPSQGGLDVIDIPFLCDCSGETYSVFAPLYLDSEVPVAGALSWIPGLSVAYPYGTLSSGRWDLGAYVPNAQTCWFVIIHGCINIPTMGLISPLAGSSLPGASFVPVL